MLGWIYNLARKLKRNNRFPILRTLLNSMYHDPRMVIIKMKNFDIVEVDGCKFHVNDQIDSIQRVFDNPWFSNMKPDDIALDIGANIGAITIPLARAVKKVYAIEPLFVEELEQNISLNRLDNIRVIKCGVGPYEDNCKFEFSSKQGVAQSIPFRVLKARVGRIDFIKIDGEGCEWGIKPEELKGIREIRIEFHIRRSCYKRDSKSLTKWLLWLKNEGYKYSLETGDDTSPCVPFSKCMILNATRNGKWE